MKENLFSSTEQSQLFLYRKLKLNIEQIMREHQVPPYLVLDTNHAIFTPMKDVAGDAAMLSEWWGIPLRFNPDNQATRAAIKARSTADRQVMRVEILNVRKQLREVPDSRIYMIVCGRIAPGNTSLAPEHVKTQGVRVLVGVVGAHDQDMSDRDLQSLSHTIVHGDTDRTHLDRYLFALTLKTGMIPAGIDGLANPLSLYRIAGGAQNLR
jgi:hypothetical protein